MDNSTKSCYNYGRRRKPYEELTLADDFMFCKVMQDEKLCKRLLEIILNKPIEKIVYRESQKVFDDTIDGKSIRLDVYVQDEKHSVYDLEMQTTDTKELPKRSRYYLSSIDKGQLEKGCIYNELKEAYVIFICLFDLFGKNHAKYTFEKTCREDNTVKLEDEQYTVFINAEGVTNEKELQDFLVYLKTGNSNQSEFAKDLDSAVKKASMSKEWKEEYDMLAAREQLLKNLGHEEGRAEGRVEGLEAGRNEERVVLVKQLLKNYTPHVVSTMLDIPLEEILEIKKK